MAVVWSVPPTDTFTRSGYRVSWKSGGPWSIEGKGSAARAVWAREAIAKIRIASDAARPARPARFPPGHCNSPDCLAAEDKVHRTRDAFAIEIPDDQWSQRILGAYLRWK